MLHFEKHKAFSLHFLRKTQSLHVAHFENAMSSSCNFNMQSIHFAGLEEGNAFTLNFKNAKCSHCV